VFFFGGGWRLGNTTQFYAKAEYLASRGLVAFCADYRIKNRHQTAMDQAVQDARSAMRFIRGQAEQWGVDGGKIIAGGGSSGGHLAAACALLDSPDDPADDPKISCRPKALLLFNPALDLISQFRQGGKFGELIRNVAPGDSDQAKLAALEKLSPHLFLNKDGPPAVMFFGSGDPYLPDAQAFVARSRLLGNRAEIWIAQGMGHGFFNAAPWHQATLIKVDEFLISLGYLQGRPAIRSVDAAAVLTP
jgi:acetyl esterase/lipase